MSVQPAAILHPNLSHFSKEGALRGVVVMLSKLHVIVGTIFILFQVTHNQFDKRVCKKSVDVHYICTLMQDAINQSHMLFIFFGAYF